MYCWKCGQELTDGAGNCVYCSAKQARPEPASEVGKALRMLYDRYGRDAVLTNNLFLVNGLGDLVEDSQKLRGQIKMAMDAGMGRMLLDQLNGAGAPDAAFDARLKVLLTDDAGLSDRIAGEIAGYMDEMIGWREAASRKTPAPMPELAYTPEKHVEIDRATGRVYRRPEIERQERPARRENVSPLPVSSLPVPPKPKGVGFLIAAIAFAAYPFLLFAMTQNLEPTLAGVLGMVAIFGGIAAACFYGYRRRAGKVDGSLLSLRRTPEGVVCEWSKVDPGTLSLAINGQWVARGVTSPWTLFDVPGNAEILLASQIHINLNTQFNYIDRGYV